MFGAADATTLLAVLIPTAAGMLGGLLHVVYRMGILTQEVKRLRADFDRMWQTEQGVISYRKEQHGQDSGR